MIWIFLYIVLSISSIVALVIFESLDEYEDLYEPNYVLYVFVFILGPLFLLLIFLLGLIWSIVKITRMVIIRIRGCKDSEQKKFEKERDMFLS